MHTEEIEPVCSAKDLLLRMFVEEVPGIWTQKAVNCVQEERLA